MFRTPILLLLFVGTCGTCGPATAQVRQFPYKARVVVEQTYVRSGGGEAFYPTAELRRDATVTVRRHDPGGWYMIDPPKGSFSWIPSKHTRRLSSDSAEMLESNVVVFVGSSFGDETHVWQRKMMAGEKVTVLGEQQVDTLSGPKQMLKIAPPKREYRWLPGSAVIPVGDTARADHDRNPYSVPSNAVDPRSQQQKTAATAPAPQPANSSVSPSTQLLKLKQIREEQRQLQAIDQRFRSMILSPPSKWKLDSVEADYRELQNGAKYKPVAGQIDLRFPAIKRYRLRKAEWDDLNRLTSETERRDSELLSTQFNLPPTATSQMIVNEQFVAGPQPAVFGPQLQPIPEQLPLPFPSILNDATIGLTATGSKIQSPSEGQQLPATTVSNGDSSFPASSRYIGAGIIQRSTGTENETYLLTSSAGKILAHLTPTESVSLEDYVGKAVGLHGKRWFEDTTQHDAIEVSGVEVVRIRQ